MQSIPTASVVIPTRSRPAYLEVTLASVTPQAQQAGAEVLVVSDGPDPTSAEIAGRYRARCLALSHPGGANAARNMALGAARGDLIVFVDDDVEVPPGWLQAMLEGARQTPDRDVFGGPIEARLEGGGPRACGREPAPITTLDLGAVDRDVALVWSANMAIRRRALERTGPFDETIFVRGDEEEWQRRYAAGGEPIRYLAGAGLVHRRSAEDSTLTSLARAAYRQGRASRRYDVRKDAAPTLMAELRTLAGCGWHTVRRRCAVGLVLAAHSAGRLQATLGEARRAPRTFSGDAGSSPMTEDLVGPGPEDFLSGTSGQVFGIRMTSSAIAADAVADAVSLATAQRRRLRRAARQSPRRRVLALGIERTDVPNVLGAARAELLRSRHDVHFAATAAGTRGKFENLNDLLEGNSAAGIDWLVVVDDDVALPAGFLDAFIFLCERFELRLAQPAHRARSHAAYEVTRRRPGSVVRETSFVEIGPLFAFHASTFDVLLPFPPLRIGWGLDSHWSAVARQRGWRMGIIDATAVRHGLRLIASSYPRQAAIDEARAFLSDRPYTPAAQAQRTLVTHRRWSRG